MIDKHERAIQSFGVFVTRFVGELNQLADDGWAVLVEGKRDEIALRALGFRGILVTVSGLGRKGPGTLAKTRKMVILTDLDREGAFLAARFIKKFGHEGLRVSMAERRRLKAASRGVFLHVENLSRFADSEHVLMSDKK